MFKKWRPSSPSSSNSSSESWCQQANCPTTKKRKPTRSNGWQKTWSILKINSLGLPWSKTILYDKLIRQHIGNRGRKHCHRTEHKPSPQNLRRETREPLRASHPGPVCDPTDTKPWNMADSKRKALQRLQVLAGDTSKSFCTLKRLGFWHALLVWDAWGSWSALRFNGAMTSAERWGWLGLELVHGPFCLMLWLEDRQNWGEEKWKTCAQEGALDNTGCVSFGKHVLQGILSGGHEAHIISSYNGPWAYAAGFQQASCKTFIFSITVIDSLWAHFWDITAERPACLASVCSFLLWTSSCLWKGMHQTLRKKTCPSEHVLPSPPTKKSKSKKHVNNTSCALYITGTMAKTEQILT